MFIIGVYGLSGSGKSTLSKKLAEDLNATYVDVDKYWRNVFYSNAFQKTIVPFLKKEKNLERPDDYVDNGTVRIKDLKVSRAQAEIMRKLLYQYLNYRINRKLRKTNSDIVVVDHIKFFEFDAFKKSDYVIFVNTPAAICQQNIMKRDYITQKRMEYLVEQHVVDQHNEFPFVPHNFEINAFEKDYKQKYENLREELKQEIELKPIVKAKNKIKFSAKSEKLRTQN